MYIVGRQYTLGPTPDPPESSNEVDTSHPEVPNTVDLDALNFDPSVEAPNFDPSAEAPDLADEIMDHSDTIDTEDFDDFNADSQAIFDQKALSQLK